MNFQASRNPKAPSRNTEAPKPKVKNAEKIKFSGKLYEELFNKIAEEQAKLVRLINPDLPNSKSNQKNSNKNTQLRRFYDELLVWHNKVNLASDKDKKYEECAPFIKMINAKVAYANGRKSNGQPLIDDYFRALFSHCIKEVKDAESLKNCKLFMEAFMGFCKAYGND